MIELLAPAGNFEKLLTALHFGADAIYLAGKNYGLRAFADNFDDEQLEKATQLIHSLGKKVYVTVNIFAHNNDFGKMQDYLQMLERIGVDAIIVSDPGIFSLARTCTPKLELHISTQANVTNKYSAKYWVEEGAKRIVLARELTLNEVREIGEYLNGSAELEAFVHGAMCISYSGRCLLSNYMANRLSNHGECAQSCRWEYAIMEKSRGEYMPIEEDSRGTYILNSKDMNMIEHIDKLAAAGVTSFKIEGRVKSPYYVASIVNAYRRAIDIYESDPNNYICPNEIINDLEKASHRKYCSGFYLGERGSQCYETSKPKQDYDFVAIVTDVKDDGVIVEQRNRFKIGDELEVLSSGDDNGKKLIIKEMYSDRGESLTDAYVVQQKIKLITDLNLSPQDILRKKNA